MMLTLLKNSSKLSKEKRRFIIRAIGNFLGMRYKREIWLERKKIFLFNKYRVINS